jgi:hypothetical protein
MVIGVSYMQRLNPLDPLKPKWKPIKDSASFHVWARLTKWDFKKSIGKGFNVLQKTLEDKTGKHTGVARGLDSTGNGLPGDPKRKQLKKQFTKVVPKKHSNKLYAELVALKLNIAASQLGKTPVGFGELVYDVDGSPFDEMSILEISEGADSSMTYWQWYDTAYYNPLYNALYQTNRAFVGKLDTVSFEAGEKLELKGQVDLSAVPFLKQGPIPARRIVPTTAATESEEDFDFEDEEWEEFEDNASTPLAKLYQNFPNPFNPATRLGFRLREESVVTVGIYNVLGEEVARLLEGESLDEGFQSVEFTTRDAPSGVYFYQIRARGGETGDLTILTGKMLLLK